jgi:dTDP-4-amino-4,6-dideoxygalactose transaminase
MKIPITKPVFGDIELAAVQEPLKSGWIVQGPRVAEFEQRFAQYTGAACAVATTSCTTALHLALIALGVGPGDEVIVPAFTWVATANVIEMQRAQPVFADIELDTFNIDPSQLQRQITARTKAIMPVSLFGLSAAMDPIMDLAKRHGLKVVEDAACAVGALYNGQHAGTRADIGCFSFHPRKAITTGEGGMIITAREDIAQLVRSLRDHGASTSDLARHLGARSYVMPEFDILGYNYRMTDLQGALGVVQMNRLASILDGRTRVAARYDQHLRRLDWLRRPVVPEDCQHSYQSYVCLFQPERPTLANVDRLRVARNALMGRLETAGVATRPGTHAVHLLGYYHKKYGLSPEAFPNALFADHLSLALPIYPQMTDAEQDFVLEQLAK